MTDDLPYAGDTLLLQARRPATRTAGLRVTVLAGPDRGRVHDFAEGECVVGRSPAADLTLQDASVSLHHAELKAVRGEIIVVNLESLNRTLCAGVALRNATVPGGTELQLGRSTLRVELLSNEPVETQSEASVFGKLRAQSGAMRKLFWLLERVASSDLSVLLEGNETETYHAAQELHARSRHASAPFVTFDCGAATALLGALGDATGGTLFLSDVGVLSLAEQAQLEQLLTAPTFAYRVIAASSSDLRVAVNRDTFRERLYDRVAQVRARIPPLGERPEDIPVLVLEALQGLRPEIDAARSISKAGLRELKSRPFAGGVNELRAVVERAALVASGPVITPADLAMERMMAGERGRTSGVLGDEVADFKESKRTIVDQFEHDYLTRLIARCGNNLSAAASASGVERHHLRTLLRKHGLRSKDEEG